MWTQFTKIGSPLTSSATEDELSAYVAASTEFETPLAAATRVLVVGATGRVGRVLVRKLLLRGYKVSALVRAKPGAAAPPTHADVGLPESVRLFTGDVGDYDAVKAAVADTDKVVYAAAARTALTADLTRVDGDGPAVVAKALQDARNAAARREASAAPPPGAKPKVAERAEFERDWAVEHAGPDEAGPGPGRGRAARDAATDRASASVNDRGNLVFEGVVRSRGGYAQAGAPLPAACSLAGTEGLLVRVSADGAPYTVTLTTAAGAVFGARVVAPAKYANFRLPFTAFRPLSRGAPPTVDGADVARVGLRFAPPPPSADPAPGGGAFRIELDRVKALPGGGEPDFVLLSCAGAGVAASAASPLASTDDAPDAATAAAAADRIVSAKRAGEAALRRTGLGYVIVRPGPLLEEPGGYRALVFDQGGRVRQPLACADAADVCLKALHDPLARNKAFDVGYEYAPDGGLTNFELVAHLPDKANNYLSPALAVLEKNT